MKRIAFALFFVIGFLSAGPGANPDRPHFPFAVSEAEALIGRPLTPISIAGVARRSTVGLGAPGVGVAPANLGGPVNRVGLR